MQPHQWSKPVQQEDRKELPRDAYPTFTRAPIIHRLEWVRPRALVHAAIVLLVVFCPRTRSLSTEPSNRLGMRPKANLTGVRATHFVMYDIEAYQTGLKSLNLSHNQAHQFQTRSLVAIILVRKCMQSGPNNTLRSLSAFSLLL